MPYATLDDLLKLISKDDLISLTDDEDLGVIVTDKVDHAVMDAESEVNGWCGKRYATPFDPVPGIIRKLTVDITIYNLYSRRGGAGDDLEKRYDDGIRFLKSVAKGEASLGAAEKTVSGSQSQAPSISSSKRLFTRNTMKGF